MLKQCYKGEGLLQACIPGIYINTKQIIVHHPQSCDVVFWSLAGRHKLGHYRIEPAFKMSYNKSKIRFHIICNWVFTLQLNECSILPKIKQMVASIIYVLPKTW